VRRAWSAAVFLTLSLVNAGLYSADKHEPDVLRSNPFSQPDAAGGARKRSEPGTERRKPTEMVLRGTLTAGSDPLANISGVIVEIGGEVAGYQLVSVGEREVILEKDGVRRTLRMGNE
jgi:hypothetical protein